MTVAATLAWVVFHDRNWNEPVHRLRLCSTPCTLRPKTALLVKAAGFGFYDTIARSEVCTSPDDAVTRFINARLGEIERHQADIARLRAEIEAARTLTPDDPVVVLQNGPT